MEIMIVGLVVVLFSTTYFIYRLAAKLQVQK